jgi:hypothetical protein
MPRFTKPQGSKPKQVPFQREVPPPSPSAGTPKVTDPWSVQQGFKDKSAAEFTNEDGKTFTGMKALQEYAKYLDKQSIASAYDARTKYGAPPAIGGKGVLNPMAAGMSANMNALGMVGGTLNPWLVRTIKDAITPNIKFDPRFLPLGPAAAFRGNGMGNDGAGRKNNLLASFANDWEDVLTGQASKGDMASAVADLFGGKIAKATIKGGSKGIKSLKNIIGKLGN